MVTRLIAAPTTEPVTLDEVKIHLREESTDNDLLIASLITSARERCEHSIGRSIMPQTWEKVIDYFPIIDISLMWPSLIEVLSIKYLDVVGDQQTLATDQYRVDIDNEPGKVTLSPGASWPSTYPVPNAVRVRYRAGYADAASVPEGIRSWIKLAVRAMYDGCPITGLDSSMKPFDALLDRVRIWRL
jgi:uncharacterized phiE125 gp8 family phage protein